MKPKDIIMLYQSMTNEEKARLVFNSLMTESEDKIINEISATVPTVAYSQLDDDYLGRVNIYYDIAIIWGLEYWRNYCKMLASITLSNSSFKNGDIDKHAKYDDLQYIWEDRLLALGVLLNDLEAEYGLSVDSIIRGNSIELIYGLEIEFDQLSEQGKKYYSGLKENIDQSLSKFVT